MMSAKQSVILVLKEYAMSECVQKEMNSVNEG